MSSKNYEMDSIFKIHETTKYYYNKKKEDFLQIPPVEGTLNEANNAGGRIVFQVNSVSNWLLFAEAYLRCDFKITNNAGTDHPAAGVNSTLENNFFPNLFSEIRLEAGSSQVENLTDPGVYDTMLKLIWYPDQKYDNDSGWVPDSGDGNIVSPLEANDPPAPEGAYTQATMASLRLNVTQLRNRVRNEPNHGYQMRKILYNNESGNAWVGNVNWKLSPLLGILDHRKVSIKTPYKLTLVRNLDDNKIFFGANANDNIKFSITNIYLYVPVISPSIEVETKLITEITKEINISYLKRNTIASVNWSSNKHTWNITTTTKPARYIILGFKQLADAKNNNNNKFWIKDNNDRITRLQVRLNNERYPDLPLTIDTNLNDYNELYRNYKNMCTHFGNVPQLNFNDFINNYPIFCIDLSAHKEDLFKTGVQLTVYVEKDSGNAAHVINAFCLILEEAEIIVNKDGLYKII